MTKPVKLMKIAIANNDKGFWLSEKAKRWLREKGLNDSYIFLLEHYGEYRAHRLLIECIETLGNEVNANGGNIVIITAPEQPYHIVDYGLREVLVTEDDLYNPTYDFK